MIWFISPTHWPARSASARFTPNARNGSPDRREKTAKGPAAFRDRLILSEDQLSRMFDVLARRLNNVFRRRSEGNRRSEGTETLGIQMKLLNKQVPWTACFKPWLQRS